MLVRKKPIVVEAFHYTERLLDCHHVFMGPEWLREAYEDGILRYNSFGELVIETLEGNMHVSPDDYIIRGIYGELYACKPDIFWETYEEAEF